jgi:hypothetical protein
MGLWVSMPVLPAVAHLHLAHDVDAREAIHHDCDEGAVLQPNQCRLLGFRLATAPPCVPYQRNAVEQLAGFFGRELWTAEGMRMNQQKSESGCLIAKRRKRRYRLRIRKETQIAGFAQPGVGNARRGNGDYLRFANYKDT